MATKQELSDILSKSVEFLKKKNYSVSDDVIKLHNETLELVLSNSQYFEVTSICGVDCITLASNAPDSVKTSYMTLLSKYTAPKRRISAEILRNVFK